MLSRLDSPRDFASGATVCVRVFEKVSAQLKLNSRAFRLQYELTLDVSIDELTKIINAVRHRVWFQSKFFGGDVSSRSRSNSRLIFF